MPKTKSKKLLIVESPAKAKTIGKYIGDDYKVMASVGHVRDLPKSNKNAVDIKAGFIPHYEISPRKKEVVADLKKEAKKASEILLATDPDREGEAIAWHLAELLDPKQTKTKRVVYHEITKDAVKEALEHPREIDTDLKEAQEARRVLDRLFGYDLSGLIWKKVRYGLSAGRVQSPALRLLMEREREIRAFIPETYWTLEAELETHSKETFTAVCEEEPRDKKEVDNIISASKGDWYVVDVEERKAKRSPYAPFTTSTLQQTASSRLGFSPARTMRTAQKLYEAGHITYMRTDSVTISNTAIGQAKTVVIKEFGAEHHQTRAYKSKSKNAQEAHEAVRPTNLAKKTAGTTDDQKKLYKLIWARTMGSQMKDAEIKRVKIRTNVQDSSTPDFSINGSRVLYEGWLLADPQARGEEVELPKVSKDDALKLLNIEDFEKQTTPPPRYSEARLVKELEKRGIGRPSTYASTIQTLVDRYYVEKDGRTLIPTDTGDVVSSFVEENFDQYISDDFTANMEDTLDAIAEGKKEYTKTLKDFYTPFHKEIEKKEDIPKITNLGPADKKFKCPECGKSMIIKLGKTGKFLSCSTYPDCEGALTMEGKEIGKEEPIGKDPETGESIYLLEGRYGPYVQIGQKTKENKKPKRAGIPKDQKPEDVTIKDAIKYLSLPRTLGEHPDTGKEVMANIGRFGPYIAHNIEPKPDYRSLKEDDPYTITFKQALEILAEPKKKRGFQKKKKS